MRKTAKAEATKRRLISILEELGQGSVVVEGKHDLAVLKALGLTAHAYGRIAKGMVRLNPRRKVYLFTDIDRRGMEKAEMLISALLSVDGGYTIDRNLAYRLLGMCNATSVEQISKPIQEIMESGNNGKDIS